jgi:uncharacterized protein (TIGR02186 family)
MSRATLLALALILVSTLAGPRAVASEPLVADLDNHLVAITAGFTGTDILVFGSIDGGDGEIVVVVHGPKQDIIARKKERVAGIWINTEAQVFEGVPAFYHVATTAGAPLDLPGSALRRHQIGVDNIRIRALEDGDPDAVESRETAVIRHTLTVGQSSADPGLVERRGGRLFRTEILLPTNVPVGTYTIETLLVRNGQVVGAQTTPLFVNKEGFGAQVYRMAHLYPMIYGLVAIFIAAFAGFAANWLFRKL